MRWPRQRLLQILLLAAAGSSPAAHSAGSLAPSAVAALPAACACRIPETPVRGGGGMVVPWGVPPLDALRLRGGGKGLGRRVRQLHNFVPKQQRVGENPLQKNKPHRKRKKAKDREAAQKKMRNAQTSIKQGDREALYNQGLIDTPRVSDNRRLGTLGQNFIDFNTWHEGPELHAHRTVGAQSGQAQEEESALVEPISVPDDSLDMLAKQGMPLQDSAPSIDADDILRGAEEESDGSQEDREDDSEDIPLDEQARMDDGADLGAVEAGGVGALNGSVPVLMDDDEGDHVIPDRQSTGEFDILEKGDIVKYVQADGALVDATVSAVDRGIDPPSYTVAIGSAFRETVRKRLRFVARPITAAAAGNGTFEDVHDLDPAEPFVNRETHWIHPALRDDSKGGDRRLEADADLRSWVAGLAHERSLDASEEMEEAEGRGSRVDVAAQGDSRFKISALRSIEKASSASKRDKASKREAAPPTSPPRFSGSALEEIKKASTGQGGTASEFDPTEALLSYTRRTRAEAEAKKKAFEQDFRAKLGTDRRTSQGAAWRAKHTAVRDDHRFRRYGR